MKSISSGQGRRQSPPSSPRRARLPLDRRFLGKLSRALLFAAVLGVSGGARAEWPDQTTDQLVAKSSLVGVFTAEVVDPHAYDRTRKQARTRLVLRVNVLLDGEWESDTIEFFLPGGTHPDGSEESWSDVPEFNQGERYLLFIRDGKWRTTPIAGGQRGAFRLATVGAREVLVNNDGLVVSRLLEDGFRLAPRRVAMSERSLRAVRSGRADAKLAAEPELQPVVREDAEQELVLSELRRQIKTYRLRAAQRATDSTRKRVVQREATPMFTAQTRSTP